MSIRKSLSLIILHGNSPLEQPATKKIKFHVEWAIMANHPFPLIQVLRLAKMEGVTNNQVK
jgi:hypothetical protein